MKRYFLLFGLLIILFSACTKTSFNADKQATIDDTKIQAYIAANHLTVTKTASGLYYQILQTNPGPHPIASDTVQISLTGTLLNGTVFDTETVQNFQISELVPGVQEGVQLIGANGDVPYGRILLIMPSRLGYGTTATGSIPSNAVLVFKVDLIGFF